MFDWSDEPIHPDLLHNMGLPPEWNERKPDRPPPRLPPHLTVDHPQKLPTEFKVPKKIAKACFKTRVALWQKRS
jgi:hypothetical protein